ncbi:MAG: type I restriction enzyme HsdR N-terminal domain-containing protein [Chitinophagaceae bacterium]|nr:MAG: type I restriction enzyme HsdR N-terminal domain-containing protein [Chitinophagaceae bacterium]
MLTIQYPEPDFRTREENGRGYIFDELRRKWLLLTPEEWVRQNFIRYLIRVMEYPATMLAQEKKLMLGDLPKRFDLLVYDAGHQPWMMVECKASTVPLTDKVLHQLLRYHISIPVSYMVITNGANSYAWEKKEGSLVMLERLPGWTFNS